ncbi:MAG: HIT family protein [Alphaproteobacteria bacterium]|nr:HIT family protein [Alphaproteobacteria bacterium]
MDDFDNNNLFAKIIRGEIPGHKVYEDDAVLAFMDVMPQSDGHTLVVPKAGSRNLLDADPLILAALIERVQKIAIGVKAAMNADGILIKQFNEAAAGQTVFHLHFHVIPVFDGQPLAPHSGEMADMGELAERAGKIRKALG